MGPEPDWTLNSGQKVQSKYRSGAASLSGDDLPHHNQLRLGIHVTRASSGADPKFM